jgi:hypothetical protein
MIEPTLLVVNDLIKKPEKNICCHPRTSRTLCLIVSAPHEISVCSCNGNAHCFVMRAAEWNREVPRMMPSAKMVFLKIFG